MKNLETEIIIQASPRQIWNTLMDFESYADWNPFIRSIEGKAALGNILSATLQPEGQKPSVFTPKVKVLEPEVEFRWLGKLFIGGLFDGEHYFRLEPLGEGQTRFIHGENFKGLLVGPIMSMIGDATKHGFKAMNQALKSRVEQLNQAHIS